MNEPYKGKIIMEADQLIGNVLDLVDLIITNEAIQKQEKGFLAYILCSKIAKELIHIHHFKNV